MTLRATYWDFNLSYCVLLCDSSAVAARADGMECSFNQRCKEVEE